VSAADGHDERVQEMLSGVKTAFALAASEHWWSERSSFTTPWPSASPSAARCRHSPFIGGDSGPGVRPVRRRSLLLGLLGSVVGIPLGYGLARLALGPMHQVLSDVFLPLPWQELEMSHWPW